MKSRTEDWFPGNGEENRTKGRALEDTEAAGNEQFVTLGRTVRATDI